MLPKENRPAMASAFLGLRSGLLKRHIGSKNIVISKTMFDAEWASNVPTKLETLANPKP